MLQLVRCDNKAIKTSRNERSSDGNESDIVEFVADYEQAREQDPLLSKVMQKHLAITKQCPLENASPISCIYYG